MKWTVIFRVVTLSCGLSVFLVGAAARGQEQGEQEEAGKENGASGIAGPYFLSEPFVTSGFGISYFHPSLEISRRYNPGVSVPLYLRFWGDRWGGGLEATLFFSVGSDEQIFAVREDDGGAPGDQLEPHPVAVLVGLSGKYALIKNADWFVSLGLGIGAMFYFLNFEEGEQEGQYVYEEYRRPRTGVVLREDLEACLLVSDHPVWRIGFCLYAALGEAYSWPTGDVQRDIGAADTTDFGLELWPEVGLGLKTIRGQSPDREERETEQDTREDVRPLWGIDLALGYSHPLGDISRNYPPGVALVSQLLIHFRKFALGLFFDWSGSTSAGDEIRLEPDSPDNPRGDTMTLPSSPMSLSFGFVYNPLIWRRGTIAIAAGLHLGYASHFINRGTQQDESGESEAAFDAYRRKRGGIAFGQHLDFNWYFHHGRSGIVGLLVRGSLHEMVTWNIDGVQPDLGREDETVYGLEWWPSITLGIMAGM